MLIIVMHNNPDYLESLLQLARKEGIKDTTTIKGKGIGKRLVGGDSSFIFSKGAILGTYDRAFISVVEGEKDAKRFLDSIEQDSYLNTLNIKDKGFICMVPFQYIKHITLYSPPKREVLPKIRIADLIREDRILLNFNASSKDDGIKKLAYLLEDSEEILDFDLFLKDIYKREALNSTGIGNYIAIPHALSDGLKEMVMVFGRASQGIDFSSLDGKPAKFIFLIGTPAKKSASSYLRILARLTRILNDGNFKDILMKAPTPKDVIDEFKKIEK